MAGTRNKHESCEKKHT